MANFGEAGKTVPEKPGAKTRPPIGIATP